MCTHQLWAVTMISSESFVKNFLFSVEFIKHNDCGVSQLPLSVDYHFAEGKKKKMCLERRAEQSREQSSLRCC